MDKPTLWQMWYKRLFFTDVAKSWLAANFTSWKRGYHRLILLWKSKRWVILKVQLTKKLWAVKMWYKMLWLLLQGWKALLLAQDITVLFLTTSIFQVKIIQKSCKMWKKKTVVVRCKLTSLLLQFFSIYHQNGHMSPVMGLVSIQEQVFQ